MIFPLVNSLRQIGASDYLDKRLAAGSQGAVTDETSISILYEILGFLDQKASALMTFDSIILAAGSFVLAQPSNIKSWFNLILLLSVGFSLFSILLALPVVAIDWPFLGKVFMNGYSYDYSKEIDLLKKVMSFRQWMYRAAWFAAFGSMFFFLFGYGVYFWLLLS